MSDVGLILTIDQHRKAAALAMALQAIVMGDGKSSLRFNALTRDIFLKTMDELIEILSVKDAYPGDDEAE